MWWLERASHHDVGESSLADSEDEPRYYLIVNGERARSRRTKELYGHVISIQRSAEKNEIKFIFADNKGANADITEMSPTDEFPTKEVGAIVEGFTAATQPVTVIPETQPYTEHDTEHDTESDSTQRNDSQTNETQPDGVYAVNIPTESDTQYESRPPGITQPLISSTPIPQKRAKSSTEAYRRKRVRQGRRDSTSSDSDKENSFSVEAKCKGVFKVSVNQLMKAPDGMLTKKVSEEQIQHVKTVLRDTRPLQLPVIPVMATTAWTGRVSPEDKFIILGGYPLFMAAKDLSTEVKFGDYRHLDVRIFSNVERAEMYEVEALYGIQASLLQDGGDNLETRVAAFREMLYRLSGANLQSEPPKPGIKMSARWRRMCAASVGKSTERCAMKALEPTFQLAQYSRRCYEKVCRIFDMERENGKEVKQSLFLSLQGLGEGERYTILSGVVSGEISMKEMKAVAGKQKMLQAVKAELVVQLGLTSWEETVEEYPVHTAEDVLKPYHGMDFKKALPRPFLQLVQAAKKWKASGGRQDMSRLEFASYIQANCKIDIAFVSVRQDTDLTAFEEALQSRTVISYICEDVVLAGRTVDHLKGRNHTYSVLLNKQEDKVQHLAMTVWRTDGIDERAPHMEAVLPGDVFGRLIERFSAEDDLVLVYGPIVDAAVAAVAMKRKVLAVTGSRETEERIQMAVQQHIHVDNDPYEYSD